MKLRLFINRLFWWRRCLTCVHNYDSNARFGADIETDMAGSLKCLVTCTLNGDRGHCIYWRRNR